MKLLTAAYILPIAQPAIPGGAILINKDGFIEEIAPEANRAKATIQVKVKVENPDQQLRPEMNARVNFLAPNTTGQENNSLGRVLVPKQAVVRSDNNAFVFVVKGDKVEQRTIRAGAEIGDAALRTPDTHPSSRGPEWVSFTPSEWDDMAADRLKAWFRVAWRMAEKLR